MSKAMVRDVKTAVASAVNEAVRSKLPLSSIIARLADPIRWLEERLMQLERVVRSNAAATTTNAEAIVQNTVATAQNAEALTELSSAVLQLAEMIEDGRKSGKDWN